MASTLTLERLLCIEEFTSSLIIVHGFFSLHRFLRFFRVVVLLSSYDGFSFFLGHVLLRLRPGLDLPYRWRSHVIAHLVVSRLFLLLGRRRQQLSNLDLNFLVVRRVLAVLRRTDKVVDDSLDLRVADSEVAILLATTTTAQKDLL